MANNERDVDITLVEELNVSPGFGQWMLKQTAGLDKESAGVVEAYVSLFDSSGESDVTVILTDAEGKKFTLLIENKIDAVFQPNQVARYFQRGKTGIEDGHWSEFKVVILAPRSFLKKASTLRRRKLE